MSNELEKIKNKPELRMHHEFDNELTQEDVDWLIKEVDRYETLIKIIHELAWEHLDEPSRDGGEIPAIHKLTDPPE